jgi:hypothetical protein
MKIAHTLFSWLITCIGGSLLLLLGLYISEYGSDHLLSSSSDETLIIVLYGTIGSLLFSIPAFILYHLLGLLLNRNMQEKTIVKTVLSFYAAMAPLLTFWLLVVSFTGERHLFESNNDSKILLLLAPYTLCFVICVWLFGPKKQSGLMQQTDETGNGFPTTIATGIALIVIIAETWSLVNMFRYWQYYRTPDRIISPAIIAVQIAGLMLLLLRKNAGWYIMSVLAVCFTLSSLLWVGHAFTQKKEYLQAFLNISWVFFFLLEIIQLVLLMRPAMRRYFRITPERLGAVIIGGVLLAAAFFFARL